MSNPQRYLVDDEEQARLSRERVKNKEFIENYPIYAEVMPDVAIEELLLEALLGGYDVDDYQEV